MGDPLPRRLRALAAHIIEPLARPDRTDAATCREAAARIATLEAAVTAARADTAEQAARVCEALCDGGPGDDKLTAAAKAIRDGAWDS